MNVANSKGDRISVLVRIPRETAERFDVWCAGREFSRNDGVISAVEAVLGTPVISGGGELDPALLENRPGALIVSEPDIQLFAPEHEQFIAELMEGHGVDRHGALAIIVDEHDKMVTEPEDLPDGVTTGSQLIIDGLRADVARLTDELAAAKIKARSREAVGWGAGQKGYGAPPAVMDALLLGNIKGPYQKGGTKAQHGAAKPKPLMDILDGDE